MGDFDKELNKSMEYAVKYFVNKWRHRKSNKTRALVEDVITACWKDEEMRPLIVKVDEDKIKERLTFIVHLPASIRFTDFINKEEHFRDATGCIIDITRQRRSVILDVYAKQFEKRYPFNVDCSNFKHQLPIVLGYPATNQLMILDLIHFPHLLIAGLTRYGKSNFLHVILNVLLLCRDIQLVVIDLKGLDFNYMLDIGVPVIGDEATSLRMLFAINRELDRRVEILKENRAVKIQNYRGVDLPYIVIAIDELAELKNKDAQNMLYRLVRMGAGVGIHVIGSVQRPSHTTWLKTSFTDVRSQFGASVCYFVKHNKTDSNMILNSQKGAFLPPIKGRCIFSYDKEVELQTMFLPVDEIEREREGLGKEFVTARELWKNYQPLNRKIFFEEGVMPYGNYQSSQKILPPRQFYLK